MGPKHSYGKFLLHLEEETLALSADGENAQGHSEAGSGWRQPQCLGGIDFIERAHSRAREIFILTRRDVEVFLGARGMPRRTGRHPDTSWKGESRFCR